LAELLQILCCGEESAVCAFARLSRDADWKYLAQATLAAIAADEAVHETRLSDLRFSLPPAAEDESLRAGTQALFSVLGQPGFGKFISRGWRRSIPVFAPSFPPCGEPGCRAPRKRPSLGSSKRYHRDEARHTAPLCLCEELARRRLDRRSAAETRQKLVEVVMQRADAMEELGVDPGRLALRLTAIPESFTW